MIYCYIYTVYFRYCTVRAGVCVYVNEVRVLNSFLENSNKERDKLKLDIQVTLHQMIENIKTQSLIRFLCSKRDCKRIFKWPSMERGQCPIYNGTLVCAAYSLNSTQRTLEFAAEKMRVSISLHKHIYMYSTNTKMFQLGTVVDQV